MRSSRWARSGDETRSGRVRDPSISGRAPWETPSKHGEADGGPEFVRVRARGSEPSTGARLTRVFGHRGLDWRDDRNDPFIRNAVDRAWHSSTRIRGHESGMGPRDGAEWWIDRPRGDDSVRPSSSLTPGFAGPSTERSTPRGSARPPADPDSLGSSPTFSAGHGSRAEAPEPSGSRPATPPLRSSGRGVPRRKCAPRKGTGAWGHSRGPDAFVRAPASVGIRSGGEQGFRPKAGGIWLFLSERDMLFELGQ